jgi:hypothetical protein
MGGTSAVSEATENAIKDLKIATIRVAGADRQATSVQAFKLIDGNWYKNHGTHSVIIATGANFADALSIAPFAYRTGTPVVLTKADGTLTDDAVKAIKDNDQIYQVIVVGGTAAVSDSVFSVLGTYNGSYKDYYNKVYIPVRIAGADRYDTSAKIADWEINYAYDIKGEYNSKTNYWSYAGFSFDEVFVATGENFPDALAGGQLAGGKYYANETYVINQNRWKGSTYGIAGIKDGSPILLTKDGNRAADSVIASNLAWNSSKVSVDAYALVNGTFIDYYDACADGEISPEVYDYDAYGFFTDSLVGTKSVKTQSVSWIDGWRYVGNNFNGVILGGKAAVSKDKAKQLDDTVKDSILNVKDPTSVYSSDSVVYINGTQYRTLAWWSNPNNVRNYITTIGVDPSAAYSWGTYLTDPAAVLVVPYGSYNYRYLYQPAGYPTVGNKSYYEGTGQLKSLEVEWEFARFDRNLSWANVADNAYTGYGLDGLNKAKILFTWDKDGARTATIEWLQEDGTWTPVS